MKVMVIGPMTGYDEFNFPSFAFVEERFRMQGHEVTSMRKIVMEEMDGNVDLPSVEYMKVAIPRLVEQDAVAVMHHWSDSENAKLEVAIALRLGLTFFNQYGDEITPPSGVTVNRKY